MKVKAEIKTLTRRVQSMIFTAQDFSDERILEAMCEATMGEGLTFAIMRDEEMVAKFRFENNVGGAEDGSA